MKSLLDQDRAQLALQEKTESPRGPQIVLKSQMENMRVHVFFPEDGKNYVWVKCRIIAFLEEKMNGLEVELSISLQFKRKDTWESLDWIHG